MVDIGVKREILYEKIPLESPLAVQMTVTGACNFRCKFCHQNLPQARLDEFQIKKEFMDANLFHKFLDDLKSFKTGIKTLNLGGFGEPLLHPEIDKMVYWAKQSGIKHVEIVTNASLLTNDLSNRLIAAGLDRLRISIEGISGEKYKEICGRNVDFDQLVSNIRYFYLHKSRTQVYIKTIDSVLESEKEKELFFEKFDEISDYIHVECLVPLINEIDYSRMKQKFDHGLKGNAIKEIKICPQVFYTLAVNSDGFVFPCCNVPRAINLGSIKTLSLKEIWDSKLRIDFLKNILAGNKDNVLACKTCKMFKYVYQVEDELDTHQDDLIKKFNIFYPL